MTIVKRGGIALAMVIALVAGAAAQGVQTGNLTGTVQDDSGAMLPGVTVTVTSPALQGSRSTSTDANGNYILRGLPPGRYTVNFELSGMAPDKEEAQIELGLDARLDAVLRIGSVQEAVTVTAPGQSALVSTEGGANFKYEEIDALPTGRRPFEIAQLAPGVTNNTPNNGQVTISGAFSYDNVFLIDGVDVNDNLFGDSDNLFIEDAIEETQVLTSGISAEYGRFSGGVINAITKSGGNRFSGSFRANLTNPAWTDETPFEKENGIERTDDLARFFEFTAGGPIVHDRLWFFGAGRIQNVTEAKVFNVLGTPYDDVTENKRYEIKLTGTLMENHTLQGNYLNNDTKADEPTFDFSIDPNTFNHPDQPNNRFGLTYRGVLSSALFGELQYSQKHYGVRNSGGSSPDIRESPFITVNQELGHYNAPYFDATDPEDRDNRQVTGSLSYYHTTGSLGSHSLKGGFELFQSTLTGGNSQSATGFVFDADYKVDIEGNPILDSSGRFIPLFQPRVTQLENWLATRGAELDINTNSFYLQDSWLAGTHWRFDLGMRYERVRGESTDGIVVADTDTIVPRLAATFDPSGDGRFVIQSTYGHYAGKYNESQFGNITNVGNPAITVGIYNGPAGEGRNFAPGFDPANYRIVFGRFPTVNVTFEDGLSSPITKEFTLSAGGEIGRRGYGKATYVRRQGTDFIEDFTTLDLGESSVTQDGVDFGPFSNSRFLNSDEPRRDYNALQVQGRLRMSDRWSLYGNWTVELENDGNINGEATNQPAITSILGDSPEILSEARHFPDGHLPGFQRHKGRIWTIYDFTLGRFGTVGLSGIYRYDSPLSFSFIATGVPLTPIQEALGAGYASLPSDQDIFFGARGSGEFASSHLFDAALSYQLPVWQSLRPWFKLEIVNLFNNDKLTSWNTTITPDEGGPVDGLGLPTRFVQDPLFGQATQNNDFPTPRTIRMAIGFRF